MKQSFSLHMGQTSPMGVTQYEDYINIAVSFPKRPVQECGIILYEGNRRICRIEFTEQYMEGLVYTVRVDGIAGKKLNYQFFIDDEIWIDPYAKQLIGREKWGKYYSSDEHIRGVADDRTCLYDWQNDKKPYLPYENSILYSLHVRGYTKHPSSQVENRGTYEGLVEKIPYIKELGVTGVLCMPFYEFDEVMKNPAYLEGVSQIMEDTTLDKQNWKYRINYWGFGDKGNFYMAPKAAYASNCSDAVKSVKDMVKAMHKNGIEVLMQIYFPFEISPGFMLEVLRHWVVTYHLDGFQVMGVDLPVALFANDPILGKTKLIFDHTADAASKGFVKEGYHRNIARYTDEFRFDARKFLKGDEDLLYSLSQKLRENDEYEGVIHHITDYRGFTLYDLVSYDRKHNVENGEENRDGSDYNYSWNCGQEGPSRKKAVLSLRLSQRKNAMSILLLGQATPLILAGDEFGHTALGNNNAYCQDNKINWLDWKTDAYNKELLSFVKMCIAFRMKHPILHRKEQMRIMDTLSCGYPDISYHADQAWYTGFENYNRHLGIMFCGLYETMQDKTDDFIYLAMNMHWNTHQIALPQLPSEYDWKVSFTTRQFETGSGADKNSTQMTERVILDKIVLPPRSIAVLTASKSEKIEVKAGRKKKKKAEMKSVKTAQ